MKPPAQTQKKHQSLSPRSAEILGLLVVTIAVFANTLGHGFTNWDDPELITQNEAVRSLSASHVLAVLTPQPGVTYQPIRVLSYALDYAVWEYRPFGYHLTNLLFHCLSVGFMYLWLLGFLPSLRLSSERVTRHAVVLATVLFACHPVNVEAVAWASSRKYVLLGCFGFSALALHVRGRPVGCWVGLLLAGLASPFAVVLPWLILAADLVTRPVATWRKTLRDGWRAYTGYCLLSCGLAAVLFWVLSADSGVIHEPAGGAPVFAGLSWLGALPVYVRNLVLPFWLNNLYPHDVSDLLSPLRVGMGLILLMIVWIWCRRALENKNRLPVFVVVWFAVAIAPVSNLVPISTVVADRYLYLPSIGLFICAAVRIAEFAARDRRVWGIVGVILIAMLGCTIRQSAAWRSSETLWRGSLRHSPDSAVAVHSLAHFYREAGDVALARTLYRQAIAQRSGYSRAYFNLGMLEDQVGNSELGIRRYRQALLSDPTADSARLNLAAAYLAAGRAGQAAQVVRRLVESQPRHGEGWFLAGLAAQQLGQTQEAETAFSTCLGLDPTHGMAAFKLATSFHRRGVPDPTLSLYKHAIAQLPEYAPACFNIGLLLQAMGQQAEACRYLQQAYRLDPDDDGIVAAWALCVPSAKD